MSIPEGVEQRGGTTRAMPFVPHFLLRDLIGWLSAVAVLAMLAAFFPTELGQKADPFAPAPAGIKPEWYFMFMFQTLKYVPSHILGIDGDIVGILGFGAAGLFLLFVPFLDRRAARGQSSPLFTLIGSVMIVYMLVLTYLGYTVSPTTMRRDSAHGWQSRGLKTAEHFGKRCMENPPGRSLSCSLLFIDHRTGVILEGCAHCPLRKEK